MERLFAAIVCFALLLACATVGADGVAGAPGARRDVAAAGCASAVFQGAAAQAPAQAQGFRLEDVPAYEGSPSVELNGGEPYFSDADRARSSEPFEDYSELDRRGRCGAAFALVGPETLPTTSRGSIGMVRPSGWQIARYSWVDGEYLFNRCHLIAHQLAGEDGNALNLITGTRSMNVLGMLPYEDRVASYVRRTGNHVLYRVTPVFEGRNLVATGVLMEAESVEDAGAGVKFCSWCYNVEPGVVIDYADGSSREDPSTMPAVSEPAESPAEQPTFIVNTASRKFHRPDCPAAAEMSERHRKLYYGTREEALAEGWEPCGWCKP